MRNRRQLQCKGLRGREKSLRGKNNGEQWNNNEKNNAKSNGNNETLNPRSCASLQQKPAASSGGSRAHKTQTRVYAIADLNREGKQGAAVFPANQTSPTPSRPGTPFAQIAPAPIIDVSRPHAWRR